MSSSPVSIHPYFKARPGQLELAKSLFPQFIEKTSREAGVLYYEFTANGDEIFCREAYRDADGLLEHVTNVGALLERMLEHCELLRIEVHGPAGELEKLRGPLSHLNARWFQREAGLPRP